MKSTIKELNVLVTDDSLTQRQYAQDLCREMGVAQLLGAANGMDALQILEHEAIDVVLIDLEMPVMDGVELIRAIAQKNYRPALLFSVQKIPF